MEYAAIAASLLQPLPHRLNLRIFSR